jgi:hypothetical protein
MTLGLSNRSFSADAIAGEFPSGLRLAALPQELLDHARIHLEAACDLIPLHIPAPAGFQNALSQIHGNHCHAHA